MQPSRKPHHHFLERAAMHGRDCGDVHGQITRFSASQDLQASSCFQDWLESSVELCCCTIFITRMEKAFEVHVYTIRCTPVPSSKICPLIMVVFRLMNVRRWRWDSEGRALLPCLLPPHQLGPAPCTSAKLEKDRFLGASKMDKIFKNIDPWS